MQHQNILSIALGTALCEIEAASLAYRAVYHDEFVVHDGVAGIDPRGNADVREKGGRAVTPSLKDPVCYTPVLEAKRVTPEFIISTTAKIGSLIKSLFDWKHDQSLQKQAQTKAALTSLVLAASETRQYIAAVRRDATSRDFSKEHQLSTLWANAAIDMQLVNGELANGYLLKADYWSDPEGWTAAAKNEQVIQLDEIYRLGREALLGK